MKITWYGTASISIDTPNNGILIDPFFPLRGSKVKCDFNRFNDYNDILITHPHFDHLSSIPTLLDISKRNIYGTNQCKINLDKVGDYGKYVKIINYGDIFNIGDFKITVYKSKHVQFDRWLLFTTFLPHKIIRYYYNIKKLKQGDKIYQMNDEIVGYLIEVENKKIYVIGSLGFDKNIEYPKNVDLLILPYQGATNLLPLADEFINIMKPKRVLIDHFDNTFPFLSKNIKTNKITKLLKDKQIETYVIKQGNSIEL